MSENTSTQEPQGGALFANLFGSDSAPAEAPKENNAGSAEKTPTNPASEEKDILGRTKKSSDGWDGKSPLHEHPRFREVIQQREEAKQKAAELEKRIAELEGKKSPFEEYFSKFDDPVAVFEDSTQLYEAIWEMRNEPAVREALQEINQYAANKNSLFKTQKGRTTVTTPKKDEATETKPDPRIDALLRERAESRVLGMLKESPILPKFHRMLTDYVAQSVDPLQEVTSDQVASKIHEYMERYGLAKEDLIGSSNVRTDTPPTGKNGNPVGAVAKQTPNDDQDAGSKKEKQFDNPDDLADYLRKQFVGEALRSQN